MENKPGFNYQEIIRNRAAGGKEFNEAKPGRVLKARASAGFLAQKAKAFKNGYESTAGKAAITIANAEAKYNNSELTLGSINKFMKMLNKIAGVILLSFVCFLCSIPFLFPKAGDGLALGAEHKTEKNEANTPAYIHEGNEVNAVNVINPSADY